MGSVSMPMQSNAQANSHGERLSAFIDGELLDGDGPRLILLDDFRYTIVQIGQPRRHVGFFALAVGPANDAGLADDGPLVGDFEHAIAGDLQAGVDAEDAEG